MNLISILLQSEVPVISYLGIFTTATLGILAFLAKDSYGKIRKDVEAIQKNIDEINEKVGLERSRSDKEMRIIDTRINELHINILNKLDEIKYKFNEFRK